MLYLTVLKGDNLATSKAILALTDQKTIREFLASLGEAGKRWEREAPTYSSDNRYDSGDASPRGAARNRQEAANDC